MIDQFITYLDSPLGWLKIITNSKELLSISFEETQNVSNNQIPEIHQHTIQQLKEYFNGYRKEFDLKLAPAGTDFQKKIWSLVQKVSFGETASYLDIALTSGSEKNTRAVGLANGKNPIPIIIPCHRIVGSNGKLTGYAGGLDRKRWLLLHEQKHSVHQLLF
ncbi:MAG TPA: methylated-DNA--[protein]-cysteine S-methyltransferase [Draconibacterium sp.]|nr:methylated-DNA--[protein]-cysteine S-methyltransferase [Draconibacterium sp.]